MVKETLKTTNRVFALWGLINDGHDTRQGKWVELIRVCSRAQHQALWYELRNPGVIHRVFVGRIILGMSLHLAGGVYFQVVEEQVTSQNTGEWDCCHQGIHKIIIVPGDALHGCKFCTTNLIVCLWFYRGIQKQPEIKNQPEHGKNILFETSIIQAVLPLGNQQNSRWKIIN